MNEFKLFPTVKFSTVKGEEARLPSQLTSNCLFPYQSIESRTYVQGFLSINERIKVKKLSFLDQGPDYMEKVLPATKVTRLPELTLASRLFIHFLTNMVNRVHEKQNNGSTKRVM